MPGCRLPLRAGAALPVGASEYVHAVSSVVCPFCKSLATFSTVWSDGSLPRAAAAQVPGAGAVLALRCPNPMCGMVITGLTNGAQVLRHWPQTVGGKSFPDVPPHIAATADEAHQCHSIGAHRGSIALARAVVEATAKHQGVTKGSLMEKIDSLAGQGVISEAMKDAAHEIRFAGNEVAHGDLAEQLLDKEDAEEVLSLMDAMLLRVYQEPAQVARVRERREARGT